MCSVVVLSGNPKPGSKTTAVALEVAARVTEAMSFTATVTVIELAEMVPAVLTWGDPGVAKQRDIVAAADLVIVATPSYKGSYTGLLKAFIDGYGPASLAGVPVVPVTVAGSPTHALVTGEFHLAPLMHEIGASTPLGAFGIVEKDAADPESRRTRVAEWLAQHLPAARRFAASEAVNA